LPELTAVTGVFGSLLILILSLVFLPSSKSPGSQMRYVNPADIPAGLYGNKQKNALPPQQTQPASVYSAPQGSWTAPDTGDLVTPGTITEGTTKLLSREEEK
jgi:hypothetical protein